MTQDDLERRFEGRTVLDTLLVRSGSLADTEDVVEAFRAAAKDGVPASVVIQALWDDEPRFASAAEAKELFGNLLALYEHVATGEPLDLGETKALPARRAKAPRPPPLGAAVPDDDFVEAAWRYFDDFPKERERLGHAFDNRQDELVTWLDAQRLDDDAFVLARSLLSDLHAMLELGGRTCQAVRARDLPEVAALPDALAQWVEEGVFEAEQLDDVPLPHEKAEQVKALILRAADGLWARSRP